MSGDPCSIFSLNQVDDPETAVKELETLLGFPLRMAVPNTRPVRKTMEIPKTLWRSTSETYWGPKPQVVKFLHFGRG